MICITIFIVQILRQICWKTHPTGVFTTDGNPLEMWDIVVFIHSKTNICFFSSSSHWRLIVTLSIFLFTSNSAKKNYWWLEYSQLAVSTVSATKFVPQLSRLKSLPICSKVPVEIDKKKLIKKINFWSCRYISFL